LALVSALRTAALALAAAVAVAGAAGGACCRSSPAPAPAPTSGQGDGAPDGRARYEGRVTADLCTGAAWLDRPDLDEREQPERVLDALALSPGMTVADVGAGTGYFTARLARRVELEPLGFAFVESLELLPDQRIVIFTRDDALPPARPR
jgi:hypothetical protein